MNKEKIGYGQPPKSSQFKSGHSRNKKGRPKGSKNTLKLLNEALSQKISVNQNGKKIQISKKTAMLTQLINKGIGGDIKAIQILFPYMLTIDMKEEEKEQVLKALSKNDQSIVDLFTKRIQEQTITEIENKTTKNKGQK